MTRIITQTDGLPGKDAPSLRTPDSFPSLQHWLNDAVARRGTALAPSGLFYTSDTIELGDSLRPSGEYTGACTIAGDGGIYNEAHAPTQLIYNRADPEGAAASLGPLVTMLADRQTQFGPPGSIGGYKRTLSGVHSADASWIGERIVLDNTDANVDELVSVVGVIDPQTVVVQMTTGNNFYNQATAPDSHNGHIVWAQRKPTLRIRTKSVRIRDIGFGIATGKKGLCDIEVTQESSSNSPISGFRFENVFSGKAYGETLGEREYSVLWGAPVVPTPTASLYYRLDQDGCPIAYHPYNCDVAEFRHCTFADPLRDGWFNMNASGQVKSICFYNTIIARAGRYGINHATGDFHFDGTSGSAYGGVCNIRAIRADGTLRIDGGAVESYARQVQVDRGGALLFRNWRFDGAGGTNGTSDADLALWFQLGVGYTEFVGCNFNGGPNGAKARFVLNSPFATQVSVCKFIGCQLPNAAPFVGGQSGLPVDVVLDSCWYVAANGLPTSLPNGVTRLNP